MDAVQYLVRVRCDTYNQSAYIKDALDGFCLQKTNFPYVCTIFDDASTDGEQDVIRNYLQEHFELDDYSVVRNEETDDYLLTFSRHKENRNCYFAVYFLKYNHYSIKKSRLPYSEGFNNCSKYIATCEGDDYWTDPYKLQKQVDFLEKNPDYSLVRTNVNRFHQKKGRLERDYFSHSRKLKDTREFYIMNSRWFATCTWLFRNIYCEKDIFRDVNIDFFKGDVYLLLRLSRLGRVKYLNDSTAVYRILGDTASHFSSWKNWFYFSWQCKNTRLLFAQNESFMLRLRFWMKETIKVGYRAIRSLNFTCIQTAIKSSYNDFCFLFLRKRIS